MTTPNVLECFLHDMEALDHVQSVVCESRAQTVSSNSTNRVPTQKKRTNPSWIKRRDELQSLRQQTQAMETRVAFLEMKRESAGADMLHKQQRIKAVAMVEKKRCREAQDENEQLKRKLQRYVSLRKAFETLLSASHDQEAEMLLTEKALRIEMGTGKHLRFSNSNVFDVLEKRVDDRFFEMEESFRLMQQSVATTDTNIIQTNRVEGVEFVRLQLLPFTNDAVSSALWSIVTAGGFPDGEDSIVTRRSEDVFTLASHVTVHLKSGSINITTSTVIKKFETASGLAVLTEGISNWTGHHPHSGPWHHITQEGGCFAMREYSTNDGASSGICQSRAMLRLKPGSDVGYQNGNYHLVPCSSRIQEIVIPSFRELVNSRHQFVENALFDIIRTRDAL